MFFFSFHLKESKAIHSPSLRLDQQKKKKKNKFIEMAKVHITNVVVLDNPSSFSNPFQFELTFECIEELREDLEWKMIYVGSAESELHDQVLDTIYVGPVPEGRHIFVFQADPPDVNRIPGRNKKKTKYIIFHLIMFNALFIFQLYCFL